MNGQAIYIDEIHPYLSPGKEVIDFCSETEASLNIDYYLFDSEDEV